ncbi:hypothetical protein D3C78_1596920 [compost metagenome]
MGRGDWFGVAGYSGISGLHDQPPLPLGEGWGEGLWCYVPVFTAFQVRVISRVAFGSCTFWVNRRARMPASG